MNMKYDSAVMHKLVDATGARMTEAYNYLQNIKSALEKAGRSDWDDAKRKELEDALAETEAFMQSAVRCLGEYFDYLQHKMTELEHRGS